MSEATNPLGAFLQARRALVTPEAAGIPAVGGVRRVPGLRREEVAMLAGISADYYLRLERGRDRNPSAQVLESIARVLQLDDDHTAHMMSLVAEAPRRRRRRRKETVPPGALKLLDSMVQPAFIEGRYFDILAANDLARALSPRLAPGGNQLRDQFLDPGQQEFHPEWESMTECFVGNLRQAVGTDIDDPRFIDLIGELSLASARFRQLWARHDVRAQTGAPIKMFHPQVGELTLNRERLTINGTDDLMFVVYHPDAGSADAEKLALLASAGLPTRNGQSEDHSDRAASMAPMCVSAQSRNAESGSCSETPRGVRP